MTLADRPHEYLGQPGRTCPVCGRAAGHRLHQAKPCCDFCTDGRIAWRYPTRPVTAALGPPDGGPDLRTAVQYNDAWLACQACHELIDRGERHGLARRAAAALAAERRGRALGPHELEGVLRQTASVHALFFANRRGDPVGI
jgi:hypothetical protein